MSSNNNNNSTSMEIQLLREMIQDREARMARIQCKADDLQQKSKRLAGELEQVSQENTESSIVLTTERTQLMHMRQKAIDQLETTERDFQRQSMSLQSFAQVVAKKTSNQKDTNNADVAFVSKMQAQLCKAMHSMGILDHQMELCKQHAEAHIKAEKENLVLVTEELSSVELNLMNDLMKMDTERREVENDLTKQLEDVRKDIKAMQEQLGEGSDDENSDEDSQKDSEEEEEEEENEEESEEEDEEEREIKEELMNVLQEKKDELRKLEKEIEEHEEQLIELEEHVEEMKAQAEDAAKRRAKKIEENGGIDPDARPVTPDIADPKEDSDKNSEINAENEGDSSVVLTGDEKPPIDEDQESAVSQINDDDVEASSPADIIEQADDLMISDDMNDADIQNDDEDEEEHATEDNIEPAQVVHDNEEAENPTSLASQDTAEQEKEKAAISDDHESSRSDGMSNGDEDVLPPPENTSDSDVIQEYGQSSTESENVNTVDPVEDISRTPDEPVGSEPVTEEAENVDSSPSDDPENVEHPSLKEEAEPERIDNEVLDQDIGEEESTLLEGEQISPGDEVELEHTSNVEDGAKSSGDIEVEHASAPAAEDNADTSGDIATEAEVDDSADSVAINEAEGDGETATNDATDVDTEPAAEVEDNAEMNEAEGGVEGVADDATDVEEQHQ